MSRRVRPRHRRRRPTATASSTSNCRRLVSALRRRLGAAASGRLVARPGARASVRPCRGQATDAADVVGIGVDFTSCTVLPVTADGTPLMQLDAFQARAARVAQAVETPWRAAAGRPGHRRSPPSATNRGCRDTADVSRRNGCCPKALQVADDAPRRVCRCRPFLEGGDWVVWQLTGVLPGTRARPATRGVAQAARASLERIPAWRCSPGSRILRRQGCGAGGVARRLPSAR